MRYSMIAVCLLGGLVVSACAGAPPTPTAAPSQSGSSAPSPAPPSATVAAAAPSPSPSATAVSSPAAAPVSATSSALPSPSPASVAASPSPSPGTQAGGDDWDAAEYGGAPVFEVRTGRISRAAREAYAGCGLGESDIRGHAERAARTSGPFFNEIVFAARGSVLLTSVQQIGPGGPIIVLQCKTM